MTIRAQNLKKILETKFLENDNITFINSAEILDSNFYNQEFLNIYNKLDGIINKPKIRLNGYFFEHKKFTLELDEVLHFNRYRLATLRSNIYNNFPGIKVDKYRVYCKKQEKECLKSGSREGAWTNSKAEKYFGPSESPGDLGLNGSTGWKYRAFCDYLKDIYACHKNIKLLRLSVWDEMMINKRLVKVGDFLLKPDKAGTEMFLKYLDRRIINLYA